MACERGPVRVRNEDAALVDAELGIFLVADGVGGGPAGDVASDTAVTAVSNALRDDHDSLDGMRRALLRGHRALHDRASREPHLAGMATTLVAAWLDVDGGCATIGHVGDSRAYLRAEGRLRRLTEDHGVGSMLTQALGQAGDPVPEIVEVPLAGAELLLLCTDGITDVLDDDELANLAADADAAVVCGALVDAALDAGSRDNLTALAVDLRGRVSSPSGRLRARVRRRR